MSLTSVSSLRILEREFLLSNSSNSLTRESTRRDRASRQPWGSLAPSTLSVSTGVRSTSPASWARAQHSRCSFQQERRHPHLGLPSLELECANRVMLCCFPNDFPQSPPPSIPRVYKTALPVLGKAASAGSLQSREKCGTTYPWGCFRLSIVIGDSSEPPSCQSGEY